MDSPQAWTTYLFQVGEVWTLEDSILTPDIIRSIVAAIGPVLNAVLGFSANSFSTKGRRSSWQSLQQSDHDAT